MRRAARPLAYARGVPASRRAWTRAAAAFVAQNDPSHDAAEACHSGPEPRIGQIEIRALDTPDHPADTDDNHQPGGHAVTGIHLGDAAEILRGDARPQQRGLKSQHRDQTYDREMMQNGK